MRTLGLTKGALQCFFFSKTRRRGYGRYGGSLIIIINISATQSSSPSAHSLSSRRIGEAYFSSPYHDQSVLGDVR